MPQPHIISVLTTSLDGRTESENPQILSNRLEENRIQQMRSKIDGIITSAEKIMEYDSGFLIEESRSPGPTIILVDKNADVPAETAIFKNKSGKIILVTCKKVSHGRIRRLQEVRPDLVLMEFGEYAVNLEDMVWDLHRAGLRNLLLEADDTLTMRMLNHGLIDELYVMVAPMIFGQPYEDLFEGKLDRRIDLQLEGILQYGDHVVLHYNVVKPFRR